MAAVSSQKPNISQHRTIAGEDDRLIERVALDLGDPLRAGVPLHDAVGRFLTKGVSRDAHKTSLSGGSERSLNDHGGSTDPGPVAPARGRAPRPGDRKSTR